MLLVNAKPVLNSWTRSLILLGIAVSLSSCGFHLRGNIPLAEGIKNMFVAAPDGTFKDTLENVLTQAGAEVASSKESADVILRVLEASSDRSVGTLDERGKVDSYTLKFKVRYVLEDPEGEEIRKRNYLAENRRYDFNPEQVIQSESEEAELLSSMEQDIALRIVRQLATITDYPPSQPLTQPQN